MSNDKNKDRAAELDAFWELGAMLPPRKSPSPFAQDTSTVPVLVQGEAKGDDGSVPIPPPDQARLAKAKKALADAEKRFSLGQSKRKEGRAGADPGRQASDFGDDFTSALDEAYREVERRRVRMENRLHGDDPVSVQLPSPHRDDTPVSQEERIPEKSATRGAFEEYALPHAPLIRTVRLYPSSVVQSDRAIAAARRLAAMPPPTERPEEVFFSAAFPTPEVLSQGQLAWYLWWREQLREGSYIETAAPYVILYATELINCMAGGEGSPEQVLDCICDLFAHLHTCDARLHYLMPEWITDLCLLYRIELPSERLGEALAIAIRCASLKEFFLGSLGDEVGSAFAHAVLRYAPQLRFTESRYITEENREIFLTHIPTAFLHAFGVIEAQDRDTPLLGTCPRKSFEAMMVRQTFAGSVFAPSLRRRCEITYLSCARSIELRFMATDLIKYAENQVRRMLGIKNRYHVAALDPRLKGAVDAYFAPLMPHSKPKVRSAAQEAVPEWDALYEPKLTSLSLDEAKRLSDEGWEVTKTLVSSFDASEEPDAMAQEDDGEIAPDVTEEQKPHTPLLGSRQEDIPPPCAEGGSRGTLTKEALCALLRGDEAGFLGIAREANLLPLTLCERINEQAMDVVGDIVIEENGGRLTLAQDYIEEVTAWIK